jgi:prepilin-type N-terminal cleavage/methylation domain-containing protein
MQEHHTRTRRRPRGLRSGFSLVELLAVVALIGTLVSLSLPAVQHAREAARRTSCGNNLHQMGLALSGYEAARRSFPPGDDAITFRHHAWSSFILPFLEEGNLGRGVDYSRPWNAVGGNADIADQVVSTYICPSGMERFPGKQDYGGILGTSVTLDDADPLPSGFEHAGVLYATAAACPRPCRAAEITDGLSHTLLVTEGVDRGFADSDSLSPIGNAHWACGTNCFLHNSPVLNTREVDGFRSNHLGGVLGLFGDGRVAFMNDQTSPTVLIAACTKAGGEPTERQQ